MVVFHLVESLQFLLGLFVELLFYFELLVVAVLFRGSGRIVALLFLPDGFAFATVGPGPVELLEETGKVFYGGVLVEAEELFLFDLFVVDAVFTDGCFEEVVGVEEVDLGSGVVNAELEVFLQAGLDVI